MTSIFRKFLDDEWFSGQAGGDDSDNGCWRMNAFITKCPVYRQQLGALRRKLLD